MGKSKSIKHQLIHAINSNFMEGQDKHSMKRQGYERQTTIFSYSDRKNLLDVGSALANWLKEQPDPPRHLYDLTSCHIQEYLNSHADKWTGPTMKAKISLLRKLETLARVTYPNSKINFTDGVVMPSTATAPKRTVQVSQEDFKELLNYASNSKSNAKYAIFLAGSCGLRVSECAKLKGSDIALNPDGSASLKVVDSKGKRTSVMT